MILSLRIPVSLIVLLLLAACSGNTQPRYFPLEQGISWRYDVQSTTMDGTETQKYVIQAGEPRNWQGETLPVRVTLAGSRLFYRVNDQGVFRVATQRPDAKQPTAVSEERRTVLRYPLEPGTSWQETSETMALYRTGPPQRSEYHIKVPVKLEYTIEATNDTVKVPAGRFQDCLRVRAEGTKRQYDAGNYVGRTDITVEQTDWYAPGVGLVKSVRKESTSSKVLNHGSMQTFAGRLTFELESFEPG